MRTTITTWADGFGTWHASIDERARMLLGVSRKDARRLVAEARRLEGL